MNDWREYTKNKLVCDYFYQWAEIRTGHFLRASWLDWDSCDSILLFESYPDSNKVINHYTHWILTGEQLYDEDYEDEKPHCLLCGPENIDNRIVGVDINYLIKLQRPWYKRLWEWIMRR